MEGLAVVEKELKRDAGAILPPWASARDVEAHYVRLNKMKADLICELVGVRPSLGSNESLFNAFLF